MKNYLSIIFGFIFGIWVSWPGIFVHRNWKCFFDIIEKSKKDKLSLKAAFAISPRFILRGESKDNASKLRIVSDACFR
tara:strand:+ start:421 stop:654 length:234 start_codon:yes stop_codon:yes gene_type:complete